MNWFQIVNQATEYIESHITEDINLEEIASQCNISYHYFIKTFSMITGYTLKEYIRNRRITLASYEVSNTNHRILDIGIKYGYSSNEAFSRAFKKIHGINPSDARKNNVTIYTHFPVLIYEIPKQNILGLRYEIIRNLEFKYVGKSIHFEQTEDRYDEAQARQLDFFNDFKASHPNKQTLYRILYNSNIDYSNYDYFVGYSYQDYHQSEDLEIINIKAKKAVRFISSGIDRLLIPDVKLIIYNEWQKNDFEADLICEIEYVEEKGKNKVDFFYIVSIK
jgi:AraC family transcriptional regulator